MKRIEKDDLKWIVLLGLLSVLVGIYFELYCEARINFVSGVMTGFLDNQFSKEVLLRTVIYTTAVFVVMCLCYRFRSIFKYIDKYRYIVGTVIIIVWTALSFSGSSIGIWYNYCGHAFTDTDSLSEAGVLFGIPRLVRSDEWAVFTPFNFSQTYNGFSAITDIIRGTATDVTTTYGLPSIALVTIFRPFLWGYFLLGNARGLAFFWIARTVFLFLASYEFGKLIAKENKYLAVLYASMLTYSQTIQWWYAVNGLIEMFMFGQFAIVLLDKLVHTEKISTKVWICIALIECAGGFVFAYYPAQEIPLTYIFGMTFIWNLVLNRKMIKKIDVLMVFISLAIFAVISVNILWFSKDTFAIIMNTAYPGKRLELGGYGDIRWMFHWILSLFAPIDETRITGLVNASELSTFYSLFPLGIVWTITRFVRKRFDLYTVFLVILDAFFNVFYFIGFPEIIAKITLFSNVTCNRLVVLIMYINVLLLIRCMATHEDVEDTKVISLRNMFCAALVFVVCYLAAYETHNRLGIITGRIIWISAIAVIVIFLGYVFFAKNDGMRKASVFLLVMVSISGMMVNPLQYGTDVIYEDDLTKMIESVVEEDPDAVWLSTPGGLISDLPIMVGAPTINCINVYPNLELWSKVDEDGKYTDVYNRYAQIQANLTEEETKFELLVPDVFVVSLNYKDLNRLNVDYLLSTTEYNYENLEFVKGGNGYYIYHVIDEE